MTAPPQDQSDRLLWMLGGAVAIVVAVSAGLFFWPAAERGPASEIAAVATAVPVTPSPPPETRAEGADQGVSASLARAQLALDAGMLLEPEGFSAWSLYSQIIALHPEQAAAAAGLAAVASALVDRARVAANEGRTDEAKVLLEKVLDRFPGHPEALAVRNSTRTTATVTATAPTRRRIEPPATQEASPAPEPRIAVAPRPRQEPAITLTIARNDHVVELYAEFVRGLAAGALVAPPEQSAEHFVDEMRRIDPVHPMTRDAERQLFDAALARHAAALDDLDTVAALEWLDTAERMSVDSERVGRARQAIAEFIAERAAHEVISASELTVIDYVAPTYPSSAQRRDLEGWVDIEFMLGTDGTPRSVTAVDSSNALFEQAALAAASQWQFEPYRIMGHAVEQRVRTRIRFVFE